MPSPWPASAQTSGWWIPLSIPGSQVCWPCRIRCSGTWSVSPGPTDGEPGAWQSNCADLRRSSSVVWKAARRGGSRNRRRSSGRQRSAYRLPPYRGFPGWRQRCRRAPGTRRHGVISHKPPGCSRLPTGRGPFRPGRAPVRRGSGPGSWGSGARRGIAPAG